MDKKSLAILLAFLLVLSLVSYSSALADYNLTYDGNGNLITGDGKYRTYNEFNQLIRVQQNDSNGTVLEEYIYHPVEDRVLAKKVYDENGDIKETVIYANENLIRTSTYPAANVINTSDKIYVKDEAGFVAEFNPNQSKIFYHNDRLGSTGVLTNESGAIVEQTFYEPFGGIISGGNVSHFYYEGKDWSPTIDEYDFNFRKYNPELMIFTKPDAGVNDVYDPQSLNRYTFERNNPYKYVDINGKYWQAIVAGGIIGAIMGSVDYLIDYPIWTQDTGWDFNLKYYFGYAGGGAISGAGSIAFDIIAAKSGLGVWGIRGISALGGGISETGGQIFQNYFTEKPWSTDVLKSAGVGALTSGISAFFPRIYHKRLTSVTKLFSTITGQKILTQNFQSYLIYSGLGKGYDYIQPYVIDYLNNLVSNLNNGGNNIFGTDDNSFSGGTYTEKYVVGGKEYTATCNEYGCMCIRASSGGGC